VGEGEPAACCCCVDDDVDMMLSCVVQVTAVEEVDVLPKTGCREDDGWNGAGRDNVAVVSDGREVPGNPNVGVVNDGRDPAAAVVPNVELLVEAADEAEQEGSLSCQRQLGPAAAGVGGSVPVEAGRPDGWPNPNPRVKLLLAVDDDGNDRVLLL